MADVLQGHMMRLAARIACAASTPTRMQVDVSFLPALAAAFLLMFARIGTMVMLLPGSAS